MAVAEDATGVDDGLVQDVKEILTSLCARRCGCRVAASGVRHAVTAGGAR